MENPPSTASVWPVIIAAATAAGTQIPFVGRVLQSGATLDLASANVTVAATTVLTRDSITP